MNHSHRKLFALILISSLVRLLIGSTIELGNDEVYYWTYAQHLQLNYFDHPPMVGWLIWATTLNQLLHYEIFVRLGAILASGICTFLIYQMGTAIYNQRTGWYAALLYSSSIYASIIAGTFILPDSPQMVFWLLGIYLLVKINSSTTNTYKLWCWFGLVAGLCIMCKVHGAFLWIAVGLYALFINRKWLLNGWLYLAALISFIVVLPIFIWNIQHNFITYTYHGDRVSLANAGLNLLAFAREIFGEIFYNNPIVFVLVWLGVFSVFKGQLNAHKKQLYLVLFCTLPLIFTLLIVALFKDTLPHWSGPAYSCLILIAAVKLAAKHPNKTPKIIKTAIAFFLVIATTSILIINFYPGTLSPNKKPISFGQGDFTLDLYSWKQAGTKFKALQQADVANGLMPKNAPIIINKWFPAAHIDFYIAQQKTYGIGSIFDLHQYYFYNNYRQKPIKGSFAYYLAVSNTFNQAEIDFNKKYFNKIDTPVLLPLYRNGKICRYLLVFRLRGFKGL